MDKNARAEGRADVTGSGKVGRKIRELRVSKGCQYKQLAWKTEEPSILISKRLNVITACAGHLRLGALER